MFSNNAWQKRMAATHRDVHAEVGSGCDDASSHVFSKILRRSLWMSVGLALPMPRIAFITSGTAFFAILVLSAGGVVVSNGDDQGVHLFDGKLEYVQYMEIPGATCITSICEGDDNNIYTLNCDKMDSFILLTSLSSGDTTSKINLTELIQIGQMKSSGRSDAASAMPESNCRFITKYQEDLYVLGKWKA